MRAETSKLRSILRNSELNFYMKSHLIQAYLLSKGTFQCSTWAALSASFYRRFHGNILGMYRDALGAHHTPMCVNSMYDGDDIVFNNSLIYPNTLIRLNRLLLFVRIVRKNPPIVLNVLLQANFGDKSWASCLQHDLAWLAFSDNFRACAPFSLDQWVGFFRSRPESANAIRKFCMSPWANVSIHKNAIRVVGLNHTHFCEHCSFGCDSDQQLALHLFKHHGIKDPIRLYVNGTRCHICLKEFWVRESVLNHIRRGRTPCRRQAILRGPLLSNLEADGIELELRSFYRDQHRRGLRRHSSTAPCVRASGPLPQKLVGPVRVV